MQRMTLDEISVAINRVMGAYQEAGTLQQATLVNQYLPQIKNIAAQVTATLADGLHLNDIESLVQIVKPLMLLVGEVTTLPGEQKKTFVKESVWVIYKAYDGGPDGSQNNINIPWVPSPFEEKIESMVVPFVASIVVEALFPVLKAKGEIK